MINLILEEFLEEMATVYKNKECGVCIAVNPDSGRVGKPYFKFFNDSDFRKATHIIRILFDEVDYIVHNDGKKLWKLNHKEKQLLMSILQKESKQYKGYTNWDAAKFNWNYEYLEEMISIDEYYNGNYDEIYKNAPGYIISTLLMPDYMKLTVE